MFSVLFHIVDWMSLDCGLRLDKKKSSKKITLALGTWKGHFSLFDVINLTNNQETNRINRCCLIVTN